MTPRSLFIIILKIAGIFSLQELLSSLSQFIVSIVTWIEEGSSHPNSILIIPFLASLVIASIYFFTVYALLFKSNWLIDILKLDKKFAEENFTFNVHRSTILSLSVIVIGGLIIIDSVPNVFRQIVQAFTERQLQKDFDANFKPFDYSWMIVYAVKILIGLILIGNQKTIVNYIELKRKK